MVKGIEGNSKNASNSGTDPKPKRTSNRLVIDPAPATVSDVKRRRSGGEEMTDAPMAEKLKLMRGLVRLVISEPISNTEPPVADPATVVAEERGQAEELPANINAPLDVDFSHLHLLAETSAIAEQLLNASQTNESSK